MDIRTTTSNKTTEILVSGRCTYDDHDRFRDVITPLVADRGHRIVIDLAQLEFIDSAGLGMLIYAKDQLERNGGSIFLRSPQGLVKKVMDIVHFEAVIPVL